MLKKMLIMSIPLGQVLVRREGIREEVRGGSI